MGLSFFIKLLYDARPRLRPAVRVAEADGVRFRRPRCFEFEGAGRSGSLSDSISFFRQLQVQVLDLSIRHVELILRPRPLALIARDRIELRHKRRVHWTRPRSIAFLCDWRLVRDVDPW